MDIVNTDRVGVATSQEELWAKLDKLIAQRRVVHDELTQINDDIDACMEALRAWKRQEAMQLRRL